MLKKHYRIFEVGKKLPKDREVVLVELNTGIYRFAHYEVLDGKWYLHNTSSLESDGTECADKVVSWAELPGLSKTWIKNKVLVGEICGAVDVICLNCVEDLLQHPEICENCPVRKMYDSAAASGFGLKVEK